MSDQRAEYDRDVCRRDPNRARLDIRARELREFWGSTQVLECVDCGRRWSQ